MDLGIQGRKAIVCASSRGLGRACAEALARAGCEVIVNGRTQRTVDAAVQELTATTGARIVGVVADVADPAGQERLFAACPEPDILVNNNAGPPLADFRSLTRQQMLDGVVANMIVATDIRDGATTLFGTVDLQASYSGKYDIRVELSPDELTRVYRLLVKNLLEKIQELTAEPAA